MTAFYFQRYLAFPICDLLFASTITYVFYYQATKNDSKLSENNLHDDTDKSEKKSHDNSSEDDDDRILKLVNQSDVRSTKFPTANSFARLGMKTKNSGRSEEGSGDEADTPSIGGGEDN